MEDHIRRLVLEPGTINDTLVGHLEVIRLNDAASLAPYEAISYVWGSDEKDQSITIDGRNLHITTNLADVVRQVRWRDKPRALWADSICINQNDTMEKGRQVGLMGRVYEKSKRTLICFGPDPGYEQDAKNTKKLIEDVDRMIQQTLDDPGFSWDWNSFPYLQMDDPLLTDCRWKSYMKMVNRPWFDRGWVVQEAALGPDARILWAGMEIMWMSVLRVDRWLMWRAAHLMPTLSNWRIGRIHSQKLMTHQWELTKTFFPEQSRQLVGKLITVDLLHFVRELQLKDPKDRIYAFMALTTLDGALPAMKLEADYQEQTSHLDVYRDFAVKFLQQTSDLDLLSVVEHDDDTTLCDPRLSSWVPHWDAGRHARTFFHPIYKKIGPDNQQLEIVQKGSVLRVKAIIFDSVVFTSETFHNSRAFSDCVEQVAAMWRSVVEQLTKHPTLYHTEHQASAFLSTLCQGSYYGERSQFNQSLQEFTDYLQSNQSPDPAESYTDHRDAQRIANAVRAESQDRRFILLRRGYFGMTPRVARVGDVCAIIFGARTPFILRREPGSENTYKVVGGAYVTSKSYEPGSSHRLGKDEINEDWKEMGLPSEDILLI